MTVEFMLRRLEQAQAQINLAAMTIQGLRDEIEASAKAAGPQPEQDEKGNCLHPPDARVDARTMNKPKRQACRRCRTYLEVE